MEIAKLVLELIKSLIWPSVIIFFCYYFKSQITGFIDRLESAKLPGGVAFELNSKILEVQELSSKVQEMVSERKREHKDRPVIPLTEANSRLLELGFSPSPSGMNMDYYRDIANKDPNLSLAGLRIEVDTLSRNLANGYNIVFNEKRDNGIRLLTMLYDSEAINTNQYRLALKVLNLCNKAVHGVSISREQALLIIDSADALIDDYLSWMSWGFDGEWKVTDSN